MRRLHGHAARPHDRHRRPHDPCRPAERARDAPPLVLAASSHLDPAHAVRKSLEELELTRALYQKIKLHAPRLEHHAGHANVVDQQTHLNFWCDRAVTPLADFLFASEERVDFAELSGLGTGEPARDLNLLLGNVRTAGYRALIADLTTPDVRDLGLAVVRAVVPGLHPLFMGYCVRALGGTRLHEVPHRLGYRGIDRETGDNPAPHPYP